MVQTTLAMALWTLVETQDLRSGYVNARLCRVLADGGGLKFRFRHENLEFKLLLNSSSSEHVWRFLVELVIIGARGHSASGFLFVFICPACCCSAPGFCILNNICLCASPGCRGRGNPPLQKKRNYWFAN